jgi:transposase
MTKEQEQIIIERYSKGDTAVAIAKDIGLSNSAISRFVKKIGISRGRQSKHTLEIEQDVVKDFQENNLYCEDLAKKYKVDVHTIYRILDKYDIKRQSGYHTNCDTTYFEQIDNPHKAYLLGFITADGAVVNDILSIEIEDKDIELLEYAKKQINPQATITKCKGRSTSKICFGAKKIGQDLAKYGIVQNKSKKITKVPIDLIPEEYLKYYFRGLIDGDGCILENGRLSIYSGSLSFIKDVQSILINKLNLSKTAIYTGTTYFCSWSSKEDKKKLFSYLYKDCLNECFYYKRKYNRLLNSL